MMKSKGAACSYTLQSESYGECFKQQEAAEYPMHLIA